MIARSVLRYGVLAASLVVIAAPAAACEGPHCAKAGKAVSPSKPLQLSQFMRRPSAKAVDAAKAWRATATKVAIAPHGKWPPTSTAPVSPTELPSEASETPALLVREVASDELNEIDLAANSARTGQDALAMAGERAVPLVELGKADGIDRKAGNIAPAPARVPAIGGSPAAGPATVKENWAVRVWNMLYAGVSAVAAATLWLIG